MMSFKIKSSLAAGLAHRLNTMDAQVVVDATTMDAIKAIRSNQRVVGKIKEANKVFEEIVADTEAKKRKAFEKVQADYKDKSEGLTDEEKAKLGRELTAKFNEVAAEIQKESKADPDKIITVTLGNEDYMTVLLPVFKKTAQLWDVNGDGNGQKLFLEVADALEAVTVEE